MEQHENSNINPNDRGLPAATTTTPNNHNDHDSSQDNIANEYGDCCVNFQQHSIISGVCARGGHHYDAGDGDGGDNDDDDDDDVTLNEHSTSSCSYFFQMASLQDHNHMNYYNYRYPQLPSDHFILSPTPYEEDDGDGSLSSISISEWGQQDDAGVDVEHSDYSLDTTKPCHYRAWSRSLSHINAKCKIPTTFTCTPKAKGPISLGPSWEIDNDIDAAPSVCSTSWGTPERTQTFPALPEPIDAENCVYSFLDLFQGLCHQLTTCGGYTNGCGGDRELYHQRHESGSASTHTYIYLPTP